MNTYSHFILAAVLNHRAKLRQTHLAEQNLVDQLPPFHTTAWLIGSFTPDLPLTLLAIGLVVYDQLGGPPLNPADPLSVRSNVMYLFDVLFFQHPFVKSIHNLGHAPLLTLFYTSLGYGLWRRGQKWGAALFWYGLSNCLHTAADIPIHYDDGPLLLFPFNLDLRFMSPVSYWDPRRYGNIWGPFEHLADGVMLLYLWRPSREFFGRLTNFALPTSEKRAYWLVGSLIAFLLGWIFYGVIKLLTL